VHHGSVPQAFGYKVKTADKVIVISGDCSPPSPEVQKACQGCDVLVHAVYATRPLNRVSPQIASYMQRFHTSSTEVAAVALVSKPKTLILYHLLTAGTTDDELLSEVQAKYQGKVIVARDLDMYE
jgi:ribonuclease BN (tRNA processing enzyme)